MSIHKILVAEDDEINRFLIEQQLKSLGFEPVAVANGAEAVSAFKDAQFSAVLMDIYMPVMSGIEAVAEIRKFEAGALRQQVPIVALTSEDEESVIARGYDAGINDVLIKPVSKEQLAGKLQKILA